LGDSWDKVIPDAELYIALAMDRDQLGPALLSLHLSAEKKLTVKNMKLVNDSQSENIEWFSTSYTSVQNDIDMINKNVLYTAPCLNETCAKGHWVCPYVSYALFGGSKTWLAQNTELNLLTPNPYITRLKYQV
jgi:hypothetical protein